MKQTSLTHNLFARLTMFALLLSPITLMIGCGADPAPTASTTQSPSTSSSAAETDSDTEADSNAEAGSETEAGSEAGGSETKPAASGTK